MTSSVSPSNVRSSIIERLVGDSGDASLVVAAGRSMAERAVPALQRRLADEVGVPISVELRAVEVDRTTAARARAGDVYAMTVVPASASSDALTLVMDGPAIAVMVCAMFGGDPGISAVPIERDLSQIETDVATMVFEEIAQTLNGSGKRSLDLRLPVPPALSGVEAQRHLLRDGAAIRIDFNISTRADTGTISVMVPQRVLLALRGDARPGDSATVADWRARFSEEVMRSSVKLEATMPLARLTLGALTELTEGQVIEIEEEAQSQARLSARDKILFVCEFGKLGQNYTVRINHTYDAGQDFIDGLAPDSGGRTFGDDA